MSKSVWAWDCTTVPPVPRVLKPKQHGDFPHYGDSFVALWHICGSLASIGGFRLFCTLINRINRLIMVFSNGFPMMFP